MLSAGLPALVGDEQGSGRLILCDWQIQRRAAGDAEFPACPRPPLIGICIHRAQRAGSCPRSPTTNLLIVEATSAAASAAAPLPPPPLLTQDGRGLLGVVVSGGRWVWFDGWFCKGGRQNCSDSCSCLDWEQLILQQAPSGPADEEDGAPQRG